MSENTREMFMIVPPLNKWDDERAALDLGISTIGKTAGEAWHRHTQGNPNRVQAWFDRGYRLRRVEVTLLPEAAFTPDHEAIMQGLVDEAEKLGLEY